MEKNKLFLGIASGLFCFLGIAMAANFTDISDHWAEGNLIWAVNNGLLKGDDVAEGEPKTLRPDDEVTRAEMVTILKRYHELRNGTENNEGDDGQGEVFRTTVRGIIWIGRESINDEGGKTYQAVKMDELGNESVVYETILSPYGDVEWSFSNEGRNLVIKIKNAAIDAADFTEIGFIEGEEAIRSHYSTYKNELIFEVPNSPKYTASLVTSDACKGEVGSEDSQSETKLLGLKISSEKGVETFDFPQPKNVSCATHDGIFVDHRPRDVVTDPYGISFRLPTGEEAWISMDEATQKPKVRFESEDAN